MRHRVLLRLVLFGVVLAVAAASAVASARSQLGAGAAAVSGFVAAPKPGQPPFPDCPAFGVIGSRGSGENDPNAAGRGLGPPNLAFAQALAKKLPGVQYTYNPPPAYPAVSVATAAVSFSKYKASVSTGEAELLVLVALQRGSCGTKTKLFLSGYSQGAELTGNAYLTELQTSAKNAALIAGVVLFADPRYNLNDPSDVQTEPQQQQHANLHHNGALTVRGRYYAGPPHSFPASTVGKVLSYCLINDFICQGIGGNPFSHQHSAYPVNGAPTDAATWFAAKLSTGGAVQRMNLVQVAKGNYSSVQGTWQSTDGVRISVSGNQMKLHDGPAGNITLQGLRVVQTDFAKSANFGGYMATAELARGQLVFYPGTLPHLFYLVFAPKGTSIKDWSGYTVPSNTSKPRIYIDGDPGAHATRNDGASHESSVMYNTGRAKSLAGPSEAARKVLQQCVDRWNGTQMRWAWGARAIVRAAPCSVTIAGQGFPKGDDLQVGFKCEINRLGAYVCPLHANLDARFGNVGTALDGWNARLATTGALSLDHPGAKGTALPGWATRYPVIDGLIVPFDGSGRLRPGLTLLTGVESDGCGGKIAFDDPRGPVYCGATMADLRPCFPARFPVRVGDILACPVEPGALKYRQVRVSEVLGEN